MSDIDRIIAAARRDARTVGSGDLRALCAEIERLRDLLADIATYCREELPECDPFCCGLYLADVLNMAESKPEKLQAIKQGHGQAIDLDHPLAEGLVLECLDTITLVNTVRRYYRKYRELLDSKESNAGPAIQS